MANYDIAVIGGGPAGMTAALRACELGASVALIERARLGGTCTNDGCVPTRVLARAARLLRDADQFAAYGLDAVKPTVDFARVLARAQQVIYQVQEKKQLLDHLERVGITSFSDTGSARFIDQHHVTFPKAEPIEADKIIICAGGSPRRLPFPGVELALTHNDIWTLPALPPSIVVVGGGATGCQLASVFNAFGAQVTLIDVAPRLLITEDALIASTIAAEFAHNGIEVITGIGGLTRLEAAGDGRKLTYTLHDQQVTREVGAVVLAVGWPGNLPDLNLESAGVQAAGPYIGVNEYLQTSAPNIYAAGDITGKMMLVQSANHQALVAAQNAVTGNALKVETQLVPHGGFTDPEYAGVGMTEEQARKAGDPLIAIVPYTDLDRGVIDGHTVGFCKLIVDPPTHHVLGAHVVGELAVEIVQLVAAGMAANITIEALADLDVAYPTYAAIVGLAARQLTRELGIVSVAPTWQVLKQIRGVEWERRAN